jgi:GntR family histidine utilization transcriptional repressor
MTRNASTRTASPSRRPASSPAAAPALALYEQVKDFIVRRIQDGSWRAGDRLPSESELVAQFGISRMTVNRALRELTEQGRIVRVAGVGSFVAEDKPQSTLLQIANLASEIRQRGHDYRCDVLAVRRVSPPRWRWPPRWTCARASPCSIRCACTAKTACRCSSKTAM